MEQLGIEPLQLITQILNFAVLVFFLNKYLYKPILNTLETRKKKIQEGLQYADKMKVKEEENAKKMQDLINLAKAEGRKIIDQSKKDAKDVEAEIIAKSHKEAQSIVAKGRQEIELERSEMERQLKVKTVELAQKWVTAVLDNALDEKNQMSIINKKIQDLSKLKNYSS